MTATLIDGRAIAEAVKAGVAEQIRALGEPLHLAAVCVGNDEGLWTYVRLKKKAAESVGAEFSSYFFDAHDENGARQTLQFLAGDESVHGIFVELPLPASWDKKGLLSLIPVEKDVDVLSPGAQKLFYENQSPVMPPSVSALRYVFNAHEIAPHDMRVAMVGAGELVGKPVTHWLTQHSVRVDKIDIDTAYPERVSCQADMVISAAGKPGLVTDSWIYEGAAVIDYGFAKSADAFRGDIDFESVHKKAGLLTPVPGGMGPLVIAAVLENLVLLSTS